MGMDHAFSRKLAPRMHNSDHGKLVSIKAGNEDRVGTTRRKTALVIGIDSERGFGARLAQSLGSEGFLVFIAGPDVKPLVEVARALAERGADVVSVVADVSIESEVVALFDHADAAGTLELAVFDGNHELLNRVFRRWKPHDAATGLIATDATADAH
jgi:NAD(P)-dependent dehydrogenase (short-subunit alcohol dehydrogenase family)